MYFETDYACSIFGHRKIEWNKQIEQRTRKLFLFLIKKRGVRFFYFGSNSDFYVYCYEMLNEIREVNKDIKLIGFPCAFQNMFKIGEKEKIENNLKLVANKNIKLMEFDEIYLENERFFGKNAYVLRNQIMVKFSKYSVFYFDNERKGGTEYIFDFSLKKRNMAFNVLKKSPNGDFRLFGKARCLSGLAHDN